MRTAVIIMISMFVGAIGMTVLIVFKVDRALRGKDSV